MPKKEGMTNKEIQKALIENFVNMQRVLTNLSVKFDNLSDNISKLLQLFEISAKSFIKKQEEVGSVSRPDEKFMLDRLDTLLDQNKTIAKGLTLMEEKLRHKVYGDTVANLTLGIKPQPQMQSTLSSQPQQKPREEQEKQRPKPLPRI